MLNRRELQYEDDCIKDLKYLGKIDRMIIMDVKDPINILLDYEELPAEYDDHPLHKIYEGYRDFHARDPEKGERPTDKNDVVVIYKLLNKGRKLLMVRVGSHQKLFGGRYSSKA